MGNCLACFKEPNSTALDNSPNCRKEEMPEAQLYPAPSHVPASSAPTETILSNGNHLTALPEPANNRFYPRKPHSKSAPAMGLTDSKPSDAKLNALFDQYKDNAEESILAEGIEQLCRDLQISPDDFRILVLAWKLNAEQMCRFTRSEFVTGLKAMRADSVKGIQGRLPELVAEVGQDVEQFKDLYRSIDLATLPKHKMETSKAIVVKKFGSYDVLSVEQFGLPPLAGNVEVKVEYGGVNFADLYTRQGLMHNKKLPFVLGMECVGTVAAIGAENTHLKVGQRVICYDYHCGMYRDVIRVTPDKCYPLPDHLTWEEGAALFVNYLTAYFSIIELGNLRQNETVLILSCGGGVGWAATQLAKTITGVTVVGTTAPFKHPQVKENGVDVTLTLDENFQKEITKECPQGFDLILSNYAGPLYGFLQTLLKPLGRIVLIGANNLIQNEQKLSVFTLLKGWLTTKNVQLEELITHNRVAAGLHLGTLIEKDAGRVRNALGKIFKMVEEKKLKVKIDSVHPMEKIVEATKLLAERKNVGKVLISMKEG
ncbi:synaptic vesicle membrane protein VAT-1 homolog isoform X2 [Tribolium madens]|uniref:synaptic vesicle membrane protein VAT-1 homolog isoform X2 n=1 Tax=Tribolium madens TaxID=41895 RepID=UPI001CF745D0|nr:synaptic vesicle membrane protein VAT-1 homolog isoform X2 [Tribolium madens]